MGKPYLLDDLIVDLQDKQQQAKVWSDHNPVWVHLWLPAQGFTPVTEMEFNESGDLILFSDEDVIKGRYELPQTS